MLLPKKKNFLTDVTKTVNFYFYFKETNTPTYTQKKERDFNTKPNYRLHSKTMVTKNVIFSTLTT